MAALLCDHWNLWLTWDSSVLVPLLSNPTMNKRKLRLIVLSWLVDKKINTSRFVPETVTKKSVYHKLLVVKITP